LVLLCSFGHICSSLYRRGRLIHVHSKRLAGVFRRVIVRNRCAVHPSASATPPHRPRRSIGHDVVSAKSSYRPSRRIGQVVVSAKSSYRPSRRRGSLVSAMRPLPLSSRCVYLRTINRQAISPTHEQLGKIPAPSLCRSPRPVSSSAAMPVLSMSWPVYPATRYSRPPCECACSWSLRDFATLGE
jgi:hypothetical protein